MTTTISVRINGIKINEGTKIFRIWIFWSMFALVLTCCDFGINSHFRSRTYCDLGSSQRIQAHYMIEEVRLEQISTALEQMEREVQKHRLDQK